VPYREAPNEAPCHQCERPAKNTCPCCTRPSCTRHFLVDKQTCAKCDEALYIFRHREDATGVGRQMLIVGLVSAVPAFISMSLLPVTVGIVVFGLPIMLWYRSRTDRRTFLHMMRTRGALPAVGSKVDADELALQRYENKIADRKALQFQASFDGSDSTPDPNA
jgi:uncharacterized protein (DUF983 family)